MKRSKNTRRTETIAALDIGTTKVACLIVRRGEEGALEVAGVGHQLAKGMKSGQITDVSEVETSISAAVHTAEKMAGGDAIEDVVVSVGGSAIKSRQVNVEIDVLAEGVSDQDVADIIHEGCASLMSQDTTIIHCFPTQYMLDGVRGLKDPRGMIGGKLGAELQVISAKSAYLRNLSHCLARAHLNTSEYVLNSHASALAVLEPDEMNLGTILIDMGGGMTSFSVFLGGRNLYSDVIPIGGNHVTSDIAQGLSTSMHHAERLKTLHGSAVNSTKDAEVMMDVPQLGDREEEDEATTMPRSMLIGIVRPRMEEIFELIRGKLEASGMDKVGRRCVLTGGASQMIGVGDLATRMLAKQVRKGKPTPMPGLADSVSGPAFSTVIGMLHYVNQRSWEEQILSAEQARRQIVPARFLKWMRENF
ncbi:MAG: cell division protein FtsA [Alphaproteobacteria bacterium]|jgi:cell division protein FtsA|nr:cell division protein FtsA [Rickettsiales bacterium]